MYTRSVHATIKHVQTILISLHKIGADKIKISTHSTDNSKRLNIAQSAKNYSVKIAKPKNLFITFL